MCVYVYKRIGNLLNPHPVPYDVHSTIGLARSNSGVVSTVDTFRHTNYLLKRVGY